jgi:ribosomal protein S18 acetylase RimI-like enzyme
MMTATEHARADLARCIAFLRWFDERCAERRVPFRYGVAYFCDSLPLVWSLNALALNDGVTASAEELAGEAERLQGEAGLLHRKVVTDDDAVGSRLAAGFRRLGWHVAPIVVMRFAGGGRAVPVDEVREVGFPDLEPSLKASGGFSTDAEEAAQVARRRRITGAAGSARYFAAYRDERVASYCELYTDGELGQIEAVVTEPEYRGQGLASAVVTKARLESEAAGDRLTFLLADEDDWPKELYGKLGFRAIGRVWDFVRRPSEAQAEPR